MKALRISMAVLGIAAVALIGYFAERRGAYEKADRAMVLKVDEAIAEALAADAELTQRLGPFVRLEGSGYERLHYVWQLVERIEMSRQADFERGNVALKVIVACGEGRNLDELPVGHISWKPDPFTTVEGDFLEVNVALDYRDRDRSDRSDQSAEERAPRPRVLLSVALSSDTRTVFLGRQLDKVEIWDREGAENVRNIEGSFGLIEDLFPAADSGLLVIDTENRLIVVDPATGTFAGSFPSAHSVEGPRAAISADGRLLIQGYYRHAFTKGAPMMIEMALIHNLNDGTSSTLAVKGPSTPTSQSVYTPKAESVFLAPDGRHALLVLEGRGDPVQCWDLETAALTWMKELSEDYSYDRVLARFTPLTGKLCVYRESFSPGAPEIWSVATGEVEATLEVPEKAIWRDFREAALVPYDPMMAVSADERLLAVGLNNGRVLVWHLPSGRLAGLVYNTDWKLEEPLANDHGRQWQDPPPQRPGYRGINVSKPYRGEKLAAIGFDASNRLIGVSLFQDVAWVWEANLKWLREDPSGPAGR